MKDIFSAFTLWFLAARPRTLPAAVAPVMVGAGLAVAYSAFSPVITVACLILALLLQIGSNFANDLFDYQKGTDRIDRARPKRFVASGLITAKQMQIATAVVLFLAAVIGLGLVFIGGPVFFVLGIFSIIAAILYTAGPFALAYNGLGDLAVFIFFGLVAVIGTFYLQSKLITVFAIIAAIGVGALTTNILVVNNTRDRHTDASTGKKTLAVRFGKRFCLWQYIALLSIGYLSAILLMFINNWAIMPLLTIPMAVNRVKEMATLEGAQLNITLAKTAKLLFIYSLLLTIGLIV